MKKPHLSKLHLWFAVAASLFLLGGYPVEFGKDQKVFHGFLIRKPIIRIGLGTNLNRIQITSSSGMKVYEIRPNYRLVANNVLEIMVRGQKEKLSEKYVIQAAQARDREEAELIAHELRGQINQKVSIRRSQEERFLGGYKVIVGDFLSRGNALDQIIKLNDLGYSDTWIFREEITQNETRPLWILINDELQSLNDDTELYFVPKNAQSFLSYKGRDYRGLFILKSTLQGIVLINVLHIEDYLKGVVPGELSPYIFSELEAQKAQAVAARTYALKNMGLYSDLGYDLCDTPKCQLYLGMGAEQPLSSQAVEETRGEVAVYRGKLIEALYTSTCGGKTEDVENVFLGPKLPYLRSTECLYENQKEWGLSGRDAIPPIFAQGENISPMLARLQALGILDVELNTDFFVAPLSESEAGDWLRKAAQRFGKPTSITLNSNNPISMINYLETAVEAFGWRNKIENLLLEGDREFISSPGSEESLSESRNIAYLIQSGVIPSSHDQNGYNRILTRGEASLYLGRFLREYSFDLNEGKFQSLRDDIMLFQQNDQTVSLRFSPDIILIKVFGDTPSTVQRLQLVGDEKIRWIENEGEALLLEVVYPPFSKILDRSSAYHQWKKRVSQKELTDRLNRYFPLGDVFDISPQLRGSSNRVVELRIEAENGPKVIRGLQIRRVLDLRETLFSIDREYDDSGKVSMFHFHGRGWGHGVGMCQVGAFGMARAGADYHEILKKYYRGIKFKKIYQ